MATIKATYKQFNGQDWDIIQFRTSAGLVGERAVSYNDDGSLKASSLYFLRPETHKVNGKSFLNGTTHQGITLYASDIAVSSDDSTKINNAFFKNSNVLGYETFHDPNNKDYTYGSFVLSMDYVQDNEHVVTAGALYEILMGFAGTGHTHDGLLTAEEKTKLTTLLQVNDTDNIINKIQDVFDVFAGMDDTTTIISLLNAKANDSDVVHINGVETITDKKIFSKGLSIGEGFGIGVDQIYGISDNVLLLEDEFDTTLNGRPLYVGDLEGNVVVLRGISKPKWKNEDGDTFDLAFTSEITQVFTGTTDPTTISTNKVKAGDIWIEG